MIKCVFSDVDLTLVTNDKKLTRENFDAISRIRKKGINFVPCSGRMKFLLKDLLEEMNYETRDDYYISVNGNYAASCNGEVLFDYPLEKKIAEKVLEFAFEHKVGVILTNGDSIKCFRKPYILECAYDRFDIPETDVEGLKEMLEKNIYKIALVDLSHEYLEKLKEEIYALVTDKVYINYSSSRFMEVTSGGRSKGEGIKDYCRLMDISLDEILVIGDNLNDMPMFEVAKYKACPSNAVEEVKKICDYIADNDNNNSAVAKIIDHFIG